MNTKSKVVGMGWPEIVAMVVFTQITDQRREVFVPISGFGDHEMIKKILDQNGWLLKGTMFCNGKWVWLHSIEK